MYEGSLKATTNRDDWEDDFEVVDYDTGEPVDIAGSAVAVYLTEVACPTTEVISGSTDTGEVTLTYTGGFSVHFTADTMSRLCPRTYSVFIRITTQDGVVTTLLIGSLPVLSGGPA